MWGKVSLKNEKMTIFDSKITQAEQIRLFYNNQHPSFQRGSKGICFGKEIQCKISEKMHENPFLKQKSLKRNN